MANAPLSLDKDQTQEYLNIQDELMKALENRAQPNLYQVAGALAKPTRTGNALEALGEGASEYGRQVAENEKLEPSMIQMRAGLAAQKYELQNRSKALEMMGGLLGSDNSQETMQKLSTGDFTPSQLMNLVQAQPKIAMYNKDAGEIVNNLVKNLGTVQDLSIKAKAENRQGEEFTYKQRKEAQEYKNKFNEWPDWYTPPNIEAQLKVQEKTETIPKNLSNLFGSNLLVSSGFGQRTLNGKEEMHNGIDLAPKDGKSGQAISSPFDGQVVMSGPMQGYGKAVVVKRDDGHMVVFGHVDPTVEVGAKIKQGDIVGKIGEKIGTTTGNHVEVKVLDPKGKPINPLDYKPLTSLVQKPSEGTLVASTDKYAGLPLDTKVTQQAKDIEAQREIEQEKEKSKIATGKTAQTEAMKEPQKLVDTITQKGFYGAISYNNTQLQSLENLIKKNPDVMDLMYNNGIFSSLGVAAEKGIQTPWGSVSAPIYDSIVASLPKEKVAVAKEIAQIIYEQNQNVMKAGKDIYGPQISNSDATQMAKTGFQPSDPAKYIVTLSQKMRLVNTWNNKISNVYDNWVEKNPYASPRQFFKSDDYKITVDNFNKTYSTFLKGIQ
jgi:murein DD-endopeptidase MepM/ murein hydrolase activator NlpD